MSSIFDLKTNVSELSSSNEGTSRMQYDQHPPTRDVTTTNFPNGAIHTRWEVSGQRWWVPSRSYIRMRARILDGAGAAITLDDDVAPNMGLMSNLFQSGELRIADKTIGRISDYMAQVDAVETRLCKSKAWIESVGASTNWWQEDYKERQNEIASDGLFVNETGPTETELSRVELGYDADDQKANRHSVIFTTADNKLTFDLNASATALPDNNNVYQVGDVIRIGTVNGNVPAAGTELTVVAIDSATVLSVESRAVLGANIGAGDDGRFDFVRVRKVNRENSRRVGSFELIWQPPINVFKLGHALPAGRYELILNPQTSSIYQKRAIESLLGDRVPNTPTANNEFQFVVDDMYLYTASVFGPRADNMTYLLDLEDTRCQVDQVDPGASLQQKNFDVSPSTFALTTAFQDTRAGTDTRYSASKLRVNNGDELKLNRLFVKYAGQSRPSPDADPSFDTGIDRTTQRYIETQLYSGAYFDCGGAETIQDFHERGSYYYFSWPRDGTDRSTRMSVHYSFEGGIANGRVLIFDHAKKVARVRVQDGRVVDVQVEDA